MTERDPRSLAGTFRVWTEPDGQVLIVKAFGELDIAAAETFEDEVRRALSSADGSGVVLDLGELEFIDSAGLRALIAVAASSRNGTRFSIRRQLRPTVKRTLDLTGIEDRLPFAD